MIKFPPPAVSLRYGSACLCTLLLLILAPVVTGSVDDSLSFAYEAAEPYVQQGFTVREEAWGGDLGPGEKKRVAHQLFKGNEYWFWLATDDESASLSVHVYDAEGNLAEVENWQKGRFAASRILPRATGTYYIIVEVVETEKDGAHWALVYGFR